MPDIEFTKRLKSYVTVKDKQNKIIAFVADQFDTLKEIKQYIRIAFGGHGILSVNVTQERGYSITIKVKTI